MLPKCPIRATKGTFGSASATERAAFKLLVKTVPTREFGTRSVGQRYASVGASSLLALEAQILTLKETIMFLQPMFQDKDNQEASVTKSPNSQSGDTHGLKPSVLNAQRLKKEYTPNNQMTTPSN